MKRKIGSVGLLIIIIIGVISLVMFKEKDQLESRETNSNKLISMNLEQEDGSYKEVSDTAWPQNGYVFNAKKSKCEQGSTLNYIEKTKTIQVSTSKRDKCYVYFDIATLAKVCEGKSIGCIAENANMDSTIYHHLNLTGSAEDDSYRYAGSFEEVNNFVCLDGTTSEGSCANEDEDLYRIIGLFKNTSGQYEMKLIKYDYATNTQLGKTGAYLSTYGNSDYYNGNPENLNSIGKYYWTSSSNKVNEWSGSTLRTTNLNTTYLNYLKNTKHLDTDKLIATHSWSLNGHSDYKVTPKVMYNNEMNKVSSSPSNPTKTKTVSNKIGLMYVSDYGYAASPSSTNNWSKSLYEYENYISSNWMYRGLFDWTISRNSGSSNAAFDVINIGRVVNYTVNAIGGAIRPTFYLSTSTKIKNGDGSKTNPYRVIVE